MLTKQFLEEHGLVRVNRSGYINFNANYPCPVCGSVETSKCGYKVTDGSVHCFKSNHQAGTVTIEGSLYKLYPSKNGGINAKIASVKSATSLAPTNTTAYINEGKIFDQKLTHYFYSQMFNFLHLTANHEQFITDHWGEVAELSFKSKDHTFINSLIHTFQTSLPNPDDIYKVAGIRQSKKGLPYFSVYNDDILIPVIQHDKIVGVQARNTLNSSNSKYFLTDTSTGNMAYSFRTDLPFNQFDSIFVDESIPKSLVGAKYLNCSNAMGFIGFGNFLNTDAINELVEFAKNNMFFRVKLYLSCDKDSKQATRSLVERKRSDFAYLLYQLGTFDIYMVDWDSENGAKGIDDAIRLGNEIKVTPFVPTKPTMPMDKEEVEKQTRARIVNFEKHNAKAVPVAEIDRKQTIKSIIYNHLRHARYSSPYKPLMVQTDTGSGKSTQSIVAIDDFLKNVETIEKMSESEFERDAHHAKIVKERILFVSPTKKHVNDLLNDAEQNKLEYLLKNSFQFEGRNKENCHPDMLPLVAQSGRNGHDVVKTVCENCPIFADCKKTKYLSQYEEMKEKKVVFATHATLKLFASDLTEFWNEENKALNYAENRTAYHFDHVIIDENCTSEFYNEKIVSKDELVKTRLDFEIKLEKVRNDLKYSKNEETISRNEDQVFNLEKLINVLKVVELTMNDLYKQSYSGHAESIRFDELFKKGKFPINLKQDLMIAYLYLKAIVHDDKNNETPFEYGKIDRLVWLFDFIETTFETLTVNYHNNLVKFSKTQNDVSLTIWTRNSELFHSLMRKSTIFLDATPNLPLWDQMFKSFGTRDFNVKKINLKLDTKNVKFVYLDIFNKTMQGMKNDSKKILETVRALNIIHNNKQIGVMTTKAVNTAIKTDLDSMQNVVRGYYGKDNIGSNDYKNVDVFLMTNYAMNLTSIIDRYEILSGCKVNKKTNIVYKDNAVKGKKVRKHVFDDKNFEQHKLVEKQSIMYQTLSRIRQFRRDQSTPCTVYYAGDVEGWGGNMPVFNAKIENLLDLQVKKQVSTLGGEATRLKFCRDFAQKVEPELQAMIKGELNKKKVVKLLNRLTNDRVAMVELANSLSLDVRTVKKHLESLDFIDYLFEKVELEVKKERNKVKNKVYTCESILELISCSLNEQLTRNGTIIEPSELENHRMVV